MINIHKVQLIFQGLIEANCELSLLARNKKAMIF